uniref:Uncharacterized protein n=1 Tax=Rhizophora mucronata TaxID=61149 RepID=A0A2P2QFN0_RHIMU
MSRGSWFTSCNAFRRPLFGGTWCWRNKGLAASTWGGAVR